MPDVLSEISTVLKLLCESSVSTSKHNICFAYCEPIINNDLKTNTSSTCHRQWLKLQNVTEVYSIVAFVLCYTRIIGDSCGREFSFT